MKNGMIVKRTGQAGACFHLLADDGLVLARSAEYAAEEEFDQAVAILRQICGAPVEDQTSGQTMVLPCPKYEMFQNEAGEFHFLLKNAQGAVLLRSPVFMAGYTCRQGIQQVSQFAPEAPVVVPNHEDSPITGQVMHV